MRTVRSFIGSIFLVISFAAFSWAVPGVLHAADKASQEQAAVYYCPMHPQIVSDRPGDCPICHMRLVRRQEAPVMPQASSAAVHQDPKAVCQFHECPMEKAGKSCPMVILGRSGETVECPYCRDKIKLHEELFLSPVPAGYASILVSPEKQQLVGIRTAMVEKKTLAASLGLPARVAYDPELYQLQIEYLREYRIAQGTLRNRELAFKNLVDSRWEAPRIDVVTSKLLLMGMDEPALEELVKDAMADPALLYLKPKGAVWVYVDIFEADLARVRKGDRVRIEVPSLPGKRYESMIASIGSIVDPETRRVRARVRIENDGSLKPGMLLDAVIESGSEETLAVPREAVFATGKADIVFVDKGQGLFEPRAVVLGARGREDVAVLKGLEAGEKVVTNGNFLLDAESRISASVSESAAKHAQHGGGHD